MSKKKKETDEIKEALENPPEKEKNHKPSRRDLLSTGSTLLNLACSNNPFGGFLKGKYYLIVGDSTAGKTFISVSCFAEAVYNRHFKKYRLIYDNIEDGCLMDIDNLFGEEVADRIESPAVDKKHKPIHSFTVEEFYYHLDDAVGKGEPFIYVLDSMDSLTTELELDKFDEHKTAHRKGKSDEVAGSYGDGKAKKNSEGLRKILNDLRDTGSILIILSQTRDSLGFGFKKKTRSGGHSLKFYATIEMWTSVLAEIKKTIKKKDRVIGNKIGVKIDKNRITGKKQKIQLTIYPSYGIDDIGSCVDYLLEEKWWEKKDKDKKKSDKKKDETKSSTIIAEEFDFEGNRASVIKHIEENNLENDLKALVGECWKEIEEACALKRKRKYERDEE